MILEFRSLQGMLAWDWHDIHIAEEVLVSLFSLSGRTLISCIPSMHVLLVLGIRKHNQFLAWKHSVTLSTWVCMAMQAIPYIWRHGWIWNNWIDRSTWACIRLWMLVYIMLKWKKFLLITLVLDVVRYCQVLSSIDVSAYL